MIERRLTVLVDDNGTVEILPSRSGDQTTAGHRWISITLLCIGFLVGSVLCLSALLGLLFTSKTHRPSCLQWLTLATLLDTIQCHLFGTAFLTKQPSHTFSADLSSADENRHIWCSMSAALSLSLLLAQAGYMAALSVQVKSEPRASFYRACCAVLPLLVCAVVALVGFFLAPVNYFPHRYGCGFVSNSPSTIWQPHTVLALTTLSASTAITIYGLLGRQNQQVSPPNPRYKTDRTVLKTLIALFLLLVMPYSVLTIVTSFSYTNYRGEMFGFETFLTWLRYLYNSLLPIIVLMCYKDVRKEGKSSLLLFWLRKNNAVHQCSSDGQSTKFNISSRKGRSKNCGGRINPEIPVLFATAKGLFLRTVVSTGKSSVLGSENFTNVEKTILCEPCDFSQFDTSRAPSRCQSFMSNNIMTPDSTRDSTGANESSAAKRRNVVRFSEDVIELPSAPEIASGVWNSPRAEIRTVKSSLGSTYTKSK